MKRMDDNVHQPPNQKLDAKMTIEKSLPLAGMRVLDLSNVLAGPFCAYQLALMGAEVLKIENPDGGDLARRLGADADAAQRLMGVSFVAVNSGKRSMTLNLKADEGKAILKRLVAQSDVLIENFRPGVMQRLGLDYAMMKTVNPQLIYCAISGFGQDGPWADRPAYDQIIQGLSGLMSITGDHESGPLRAGFPVCDTIGGMSAAFAIAAALTGRSNTGEGAFIDVSMLESTLASMGWVVSNFLATGAAPVPMGNDNFTAAPSGAFKTRDGLINIAANEQRQFEALCDAIDLPYLKSDPRFARRESRKQNRAALNAAIEAALSRKSAGEWDAILLGAGVPAGCVVGVPEALAHPQVRRRGFVLRAGESEVTRAGFVLNGMPVSALSPAPALGEHTDATLHTLGYDAGQIAALHKQGVV
jgi:CoA:oxalate CoA-transferase